ncbi:MAG: glycosyltransferase family 9 protein [Alphaproteobacteria bacterium]|nr:glycosyltransferase family 9 protein [Alphaproteobacteria bacterium]
MQILFIGHTRIGDAVLSTGLLAHLIERVRGSNGGITVACGTLPAPLFAAAPSVERVIAMTKRNYSLHWARLWADVGMARWDLVVDLRNSIIPWTIWTRRRAIMPRTRAGEHRVVQIARTLGLETDLPSPVLWSTPAQQEAADATMGAGPILALGPTANWRAKIWRGENFVALVDALTGVDGILPGARVAVFGAPGERDFANPVLEALAPDRLIDVIGAADLPTVYACLARADFFVGHDSGLMHMAAAAGTPTLGLFGPSRPERYAPWGAHTSFVRTKLSIEELFGAPGFDHRTAGTLMDSLDVGQVVEAAGTLWRKTRDSGLAPGQ